MRFEKADCEAWLPILESIIKHGKVLMTNGRLTAIDDSNRDQIDPYFNTIKFSDGQKYAILKKTEENRAKYGAFVLNHRLNMGRFCSFKCNNAFDLGKDTGAALRLCKQIYEAEVRQNEQDRD